MLDLMMDHTEKFRSLQMLESFLFGQFSGHLKVGYRQSGKRQFTCMEETMNIRNEKSESQQRFEIYRVWEKSKPKFNCQRLMNDRDYLVKMGNEVPKD